MKVLKDKYLMITHYRRNLILIGKKIVVFFKLVIQMCLEAMNYLNGFTKIQIKNSLKLGLKLSKKRKIK